VFSATNTNTGAIVKRLRAQPRKGRHRGLSFVAPSSEDFLALHKFLGGNTACVITPINTPLPGDLRLVHDGPLMLPLYDDKRRVCGEHYTLFTPSERDVHAFEASVEALLNMASVCSPAAAAEPRDLQIDNLCSPADPLSCAAMKALQYLADNAPDANTRWFARLYALHLAAADLDFEEVLQFGSLAGMVADALNGWTVRDPFLLSDVYAAQDRLADALDCQLTRPTYEPDWVGSLQYHA
jgi:hypothetical protein